MRKTLKRCVANIEEQQRVNNRQDRHKDGHEWVRSTNLKLRVRLADYDYKNNVNATRTCFYDKHTLPERAAGCDIYNCPTATTTIKMGFKWSKATKLGRALLD